MIQWTKDRRLGGFGFVGAVAGGTAAALVLSGAVLAWLWVTGGNSQSLLVTTGITALFIIGFNIFAGTTGIVSFGHPAFVAIGAYAAGIVAVPLAIKAATLPHLPEPLDVVELGFWPSLAVGGLAASLAALAVGPIVMRLTGIAAGIMTFGLLVITNEVIRNLEQFTRGTQTFFGVPKAAEPVVVYGIVSGAVLLSLAYKFSRWGLEARSVRDDPLAAETVGINVVRARLVAWVLSAFVMGVAGALFAHHLTAFSPRSFFIPMVIPILVMAVLGGTSSVLGGIVGVAIVTVWLELMRSIEGGNLFGLELPSVIGVSQFTLGVGLILLLWLRPSGLLGSWELTFVRPRPLPGSAPAARARAGDEGGRRNDET